MGQQVASAVLDVQDGERMSVDRTEGNERTAAEDTTPWTASWAKAPAASEAEQRAHHRACEARLVQFLSAPLPLAPSEREARDAQAQQAASSGVAGAAEALPHGEAIQSSFGHHDVSGVRAHVGGAAADACGAMGAQAFATGDHVGFAAAPDVHTAAHEAAHVVQQRAGVHLKGGVGAAGDPYERHADRVADLVVRGESAERELDAMAGGGGGAAAVQKREAAPEDAPAGAPAPTAEADPAIERLAKLGVAGIRAAIGADPSLGKRVAAFFAKGGTNAALSALLATAYRGRAALAASAPAAAPVGKAAAPDKAQVAGDKDGTGAGATLPADRTGTKALSKGTMTWSLKALTSSSPRFDADFKADESKVDAKNISFGQTVVNYTGADHSYPGGTTEHPDLNKPLYSPLEEATKHTRMDHLPESENDPYYGAEWDEANQAWKAETVDWKPGSSKKGDSSTSATMWDAPDRTIYAREGKGNVSSEFETVAVVLETREPLGSIKWGFTIEDKAEAPMVLTGATEADCVDAPSAEWGAAMDKYYEGKYDTILDDFAIGKADLTADHTAKLDTLATRLTGNAALKAQLGGACDLTGDEAFNKQLSRKRAEAARDYLVGKGVPDGQLEVQGYSFDWARVQTEQGKSESKNRRVQIWVR